MDILIDNFTRILLLLLIVLQIALCIWLFITSIIRYKEDKKFWKRMAEEQELMIENSKQIQELSKVALPDQPEGSEESEQDQ